jgi:hypothetical protein
LFEEVTRGKQFPWEGFEIKEKSKDLLELW